ncbi:MAG: tetratricopeptide repeat protein [Chloroflexi bacterium]|nr:tetratricopeptide repeat protein [Chloroflexota bacterium]
MQIRTPKKYQGVQRRKLISCRRLLFYLVMLALIGAGIVVYLNRGTLAPIVQDALLDTIREMEDRAATMAVPDPSPTVDPRNKVVEANNYWVRGALNEALDIYTAIADALPNSVEVFRRIAVALINSARPAEALVFAERAVNADPFSAEAWAIRAWALDWAGRDGEAVSSALHALELDPQNSRAGAYLAEAYFELGQLGRAEDLIEEILAEDANSAEAWRARGLIKSEGRFDYAGAAEDFATAYGIADNMNLVAIDLARTETVLGNLEAALEVLQDVTEANPRNTQALYLMGLIYRNNLGNPSQALRHLQDCVDFDADHINCHYELGRAQLELEFGQEAAGTLVRAIDLGSENPRHYYWAGEAQRNLNNCTRAMYYFDQGLQKARDQNFSELIDALETVIPLCRQSFQVDATEAAGDG